MASGSRRSGRKPTPVISFDRETEEGVDFLRERLALWNLVVGSLSGGYGVACNVVGVAALGRTWAEQLAAPGNAVHLFHVMLALSVSGICYFLRPSRRVLETLDAISTVGICTSLAVIGYMVPSAAHPGLDVRAPLSPSPPVGTFGNLGVLAVRAGMVPSTPRRTLILSGVSSVPLVVAAWLVARANPGAIGVSFAVGTTLLTLLVLATPALVSWVVYKLQEQVREAEQLGQYTLESKIGEGGMGVVYRGRHALLRRPTAIKLLPRERGGAQAVARFEREVLQTSRLTHPNTVAIYDFGHTADGVFYYAMEYLEGLSLEELVEHDGPQLAGRVVHILRQACGALAEAHDIGLIHRDIKPANLHLGVRGRVIDHVKVLDFGLVKEIATGGGSDPNLSGAATLIGTPTYMAPEAISQPDRIDGRADLYALGALVYFLLTGTPPFQGATALEVCSNYLHVTPDPPLQRLGRAIPVALEALILRCLAKQPEERPASAPDLDDCLARCADVVAWSRDDAARWWRERGVAVREAAARLRAAGSSSAGQQKTVAVDLYGRQMQGSATELLPARGGP